ncbi:C40 family peptidase [Brackiella oedipodis]|uniref:C40 family peptidase n=1 Tax=Brackiella oedipodis TaxID=124225 RepID=UPI0006877F54|nr:C40 family peptidase [Brackiella oedipodis]
MPPSFARFTRFSNALSAVLVPFGLLLSTSLAHAAPQEDTIGDFIRSTQTQTQPKNHIEVQRVAYTPQPKGLSSNNNTDQIALLINGANGSDSINFESDLNSELAEAALNYLGVKYKFGGATPGGFDCSGLIKYIADKHLGLSIPRVAAKQAHIGTSVSRADLQPGDLVFFNTRGHRNSHVGIYLGNNEFIHAPRTGATVRVEKISAYWDKRYNGARRLSTTTQKVHF